jgi:hypothetical protein
MTTTTQRRFLKLTFPPSSSTLTFSANFNERIPYSRILLRDYSISLEGEGPFPAVLDLKASERIFNQSINVSCNSKTSSNSVPIVLHNRTSQDSGTFTSFDQHYSYPFIVSEVPRGSTTKSPTYLPANIIFTLSSADVSLPSAGGSVGLQVPANRAIFYEESTILLEIQCDSGDEKLNYLDPLNWRLSVPDSMH